MAKYTLKVNGRNRTVDVESDTPLLYVLRDNLALKGPALRLRPGPVRRLHRARERRGGALVRAADRRAQGRGHDARRASARSAKPSKLQRAFIDEQAAQCGYCINGMIMTSAALLEKNKSPSETEIRAGARRQSLPLRHPSTHRRRCEARGCGLREAVMTIAQTSFDRRDFLKARRHSGRRLLHVGTAGANTLRAPKSVAKEAVDSWLTISPDNKVTIFCRQGRSRHRLADRADAARRRRARRRVRADRDGDGRHRDHARPMARLRPI